MKKILLFLAAVLAVFTANAASKGAVAGGFNGWSTTVNQSSTVVDNCVTVTINNWNANDEFKIVLDGNTWYGNGKTSVALGEWQSTSTTGGNMKLASAANGKNIKFTIALDNGNFKAEVTEGTDTPVTPPTPAEVSYAVHGCLSSSSWADVALTEASGVWSGDIKVTHTSAQFGIRKLEGTQQKGWYAASASGVTVDGDKTLTLVDSNAKNISIAPGEYTFAFTPDTKALVITKKTTGSTDPVTPPTPGDETDLYLVGEFNDWKEGDAAYKFTKDGNNYSFHMDSLDGQFKIVGSSWDLSFGGDTGGENVPSVPAILGENSMWKGSSVNLVADNWTNVTISFSWDGTDANIMVTIATAGSTDPVTPPTPGDETDLYLVGEFNDWKEGDAAYKFTKDGNNYSFHMDSLDGQFKIVGSSWDLSFGGDTGGENVPSVPAILGENSMWKGSSVNLVADNWTNVTISFSWDGTDANIMVTIATAGSTDPVTPPTPGDETDLYLVGEFNDWKEGDAAYKFTKSGNNYSFHMDSLDGQFKIVGSSWDLSFGGETGGEDVPSVPAILGENSMWKGSSVNLVADNWTNVTISFSWDGTDANIMVTIATAGSTDPVTPPTPGEYPETLYLIGHVNGTNWGLMSSIAHHTTSETGVYHWNDITVDDSGDGHGYVSFVTRQASDWDGDEEEPGVNASDRFGASSKNELVTIGQDHTITHYAAEINASSAHSWKVPAGTYNVKADLKNMKVSFVAAASGIENIEAAAAEVMYFNLQGARVLNPERGIYIEVRGNVAKKVVK